MPLQWFVLFGLEYTSEVWQGTVEPERNDGKGLAMTKEECKRFEYSSRKQQCWRVPSSCLGFV